jgi:hypothetical protein
VVGRVMIRWFNNFGWGRIICVMYFVCKSDGL